MKQLYLLPDVRYGRSDPLAKVVSATQAEIAGHRSMIAWGLLQGLAVFAMVGAIFVIASARGMPEDELRAPSFFSLVLAIEPKSS